MSDFIVKLQLYTKMKSRMCDFEPKTSKVTQRVVNNSSTGGRQHNSTSKVLNVVTRCYN